MLKNLQFLPECEKRALMIDGAPGEDMDAIVQETLRLPHELVEKIGQMMK